MDRQIVYPGQILPETSLLQMTKDAMIGMAKLSSAMLGTSTMANGFAVTPTGPASLQVLYGPGEIYSLTTVDALAFSTLPADTTHSILKQGILLDGGTLNCPAPGTTGQSINYLVQVTYQDADSSPVLLPYYNSANPAMPYSGQGNNGLTQNTVRKGVAVVSAKAGAAATTGTQTTPAPDAGYIGLYVVTVAFGQTTITGGNIVVATNAPLINSTLHGLAPVFSVNPVVPTATLAAHAVTFGQVSGVVGDCRNLAASLAVAGTSISFAASELIVESALGGLRYCLPSFSKTINIAGTGAGGMDTGSAPVSGHVAIYAIYNPATGVSALLGVNATAAAQPEIYGGANMPAGYTASALISVWITNASSQFVIGTQTGRNVSMPSSNIFSSGALNASITSTAATILPRNAKSASGNLTVSASAASALSVAVYASTVSVGQQINNSSVASGGQNVVPFNKLPITTQQTVYMTSAILSGSGQNYIISLTSYEF